MHTIGRRAGVKREFDLRGGYSWGALLAFSCRIQPVDRRAPSGRLDLGKGGPGGNGRSSSGESRKLHRMSCVGLRSITEDDIQHG